MQKKTNNIVQKYQKLNAHNIKYTTVYKSDTNTKRSHHGIHCWSNCCGKPKTYSHQIWIFYVL